MITRNQFGPLSGAELPLVTERLVEGGVFGTARDVSDYTRRRPWGVQLHCRHPDETHAVLDVWREGTGIAVIRLFQARSRDQRGFLLHLLEVLRLEGFALALSPGLASAATRPFTRVGFKERERLVVLKKYNLLHRQREPACDVRIMGPDDGDVIVGLDEQCFDELWRFRRGDVRRLLPDSNGLLAVQNGRPIGYTMVSISRKAGTVGRLAVLPEHRNRGVGSTLLGAGLDWLGQAGASEVTLCTQRDNKTSRHLYGRFGFERLPDELWIMQKEL